MLQCEHHTIHWLSLVLACCFQIRLSMRNIKDFNFVTLLLFTSYWGFYTQGRVLITFCRACFPACLIEHDEFVQWLSCLFFAAAGGASPCKTVASQLDQLDRKGLFSSQTCATFNIHGYRSASLYIYISPSHLLAKASKHQSFDWAENSWCPECPVGEIFRMIGGKIKAHLTCRPSGWIHNSPTQKFRIIEICALA